MKHSHKDSLILIKRKHKITFVKITKVKPTLGTYLHAPQNGPFPTNRNSYKFTK